MNDKPLTLGQHIEADRFEDIVGKTFGNDLGSITVLNLWQRIENKGLVIEAEEEIHGTTVYDECREFNLGVHEGLLGDIEVIPGVNASYRQNPIPQFNLKSFEKL